MKIGTLPLPLQLAWHNVATPNTKEAAVGIAHQTVFIIHCIITMVLMMVVIGGWHHCTSKVLQKALFVLVLAGITPDLNNSTKGTRRHSLSSLSPPHLELLRDQLLGGAFTFTTFAHFGCMK